MVYFSMCVDINGYMIMRVIFKNNIAMMVIGLIAIYSLGLVVIPSIAEIEPDIEIQSEPLSCRDIPTIKLSSKHTASFPGNLVRSEQQCFYIPLKAGQIIDLTLKDTNKQSVMIIYKPKAIIKYGTGRIEDDNPYNEYIGESLKGAPQGGESRHIHERVDVSGNYLLVVGLTRGNYSFFDAILRITQ